MMDDGRKEPGSGEGSRDLRDVIAVYDEIVLMHREGRYIAAADTLFDVLLECLYGDDFASAERLVARMADDTAAGNPETTGTEGFARSINVLSTTRRHDHRIPSRRRLVKAFIAARAAAGGTDNNSLRFYDPERSVDVDVRVVLRADHGHTARNEVARSIAGLCADRGWTVSGTIDRTPATESDRSGLVAGTAAAVLLSCGVACAAYQYAAHRTAARMSREAAVEVLVLENKITRLTTENDLLERSLYDEVGNRDEAAEAADRLSLLVAPRDWIGEHSNANRPWDEAVDYGEGDLRGRPSLCQALRAERATLERVREATGDLESMASDAATYVAAHEEDSGTELVARVLNRARNALLLALSEDPEMQTLHALGREPEEAQ